MIKNYLLTPGPTPIPPRVLETMARPIIHHRTPEFQKVIQEVEEDLKYVYQTKNEVLIFAASGTGAMEGAIANIFSPGDKALVVRGGKFGERFGDICKAYGIEFTALDVEWGKAVDPKNIEEALKKNKKIKAVFTTLCETSTGVSTDVEAIAKIMKNYEAVLVVDAISGLAAIPIKTDEWGIDVVISGSQKGLMIPPGLAFVSVSPKAWQAIEKSTLPKYYFDFKAYKKALGKTDTPFTPAVNLMIALREALKIIKEEGLEVIFEKHKKMAAAVRNAVKSMGLELFAPDAYSDGVTAVRVPQGIDGEKLVKTMRDKYGVGIAGGQDEMKGKMFRIATMGYITPPDLIVCIATLETALSEMGYKFQLGSGVKALVEALK
ncbi:MAG: aminotransferase [Candidatus Omnitrophica bacterium CG_4_9_14_0_2_um_filter_42_8]|nr:MAG: aminotransferase [Candidatus Omnitrophica bacterium CG22_combo_CG10-13_8_21_14_all_43_16]PJC48304.1 MAG: aminotransferase [Candidatus Omnitrophica bacterium CG_4_9_14_0_2_um_filter_42_8]